MTATLPPHADVRDCRLYRIRVYHPDDMMLPAHQRRIVLGYLGETARQPAVRLIEHIMDQPWADTFVGYDIDPRVFAGKPAVLAAEEAAIKAERPLYNVEHNRANPDRIIPPVAIRQRRARDAAANAARWVHPADRGPEVRRPASAKAAVVPRRWSARQRKACLWSLVWVLLTAGSWVWLARHGLLAATWWKRPLCACLIPGLLLAWVRTGCPAPTRWPLRRWRRRLSPRMRRRLW